MQFTHTHTHTHAVSFKSRTKTELYDLPACLPTYLYNIIYSETTKQTVR